MGQKADRDEVDGSASVASLLRSAKRRGLRASQLLPGVADVPLRGVDELPSVDAEPASDRKNLSN